MRLEYQIVIAFAMDLVIGDPPWFPHPVRLIGRFAARLEQPLRSLLVPTRSELVQKHQSGAGPVPSQGEERGEPQSECRNAFMAGLVLWLVVLTTVGGIVGGILFAAYWIHPLAGNIVGIILLYFGIGCRDLLDHSRRVHKALAVNDLPKARRGLSMLVGRDTANLDRAEIVRATVESIAENLVDGVTAPVFFAILGGPVGLWLYKAVNTLDSMFGHKDQRYMLFGRTSAKIDDVVNYIPARLTAPLIAIAALLTGGNAHDSLRILRRDGRKHPSPNAGLCEAAFAGALKIQLGGLNYYDGSPEYLPALGDAKGPLTAHHIRQANRLMAATVMLFLLLLMIVRIMVINFIP